MKITGEEIKLNRPATLSVDCFCTRKLHSNGFRTDFFCTRRQLVLVCYLLDTNTNELRIDPLNHYYIRIYIEIASSNKRTFTLNFHSLFMKLKHTNTQNIQGPCADAIRPKDNTLVYNSLCPVLWQGCALFIIISVRVVLACAASIYLLISTSNLTCHQAKSNEP